MKNLKADTTSNMSEERLKELREIFDMFDDDNSGTVSTSELANAMRNMGLNPTEKEVQELIRDKVEGDELTFEQFVKLTEDMDNPADEEEEMRQAFSVFDKDGSGTITAEELRVVMMNLGEKMTEEEVDEMVREADLDGDGEINYQEFVKMMTR